MTIEEIKVLRKEAADKILEILDKLQKDTGLEIGRISYENWGHPSNVTWVWIELIIPNT